MLAERSIRLKTWEMALLLGLAIALFATSWANCRQQELETRVVRLHVLANSDSAADQKRLFAWEIRESVPESAEQADFIARYPLAHPLRALSAHLIAEPHEFALEALADRDRAAESRSLAAEHVHNLPRLDLRRDLRAIQHEVKELRAL